MGKNAKEESKKQPESNAIKSLFSDSNPFRRKPETEPQPPPPPLLVKRAETSNHDPTPPSEESKKRKKIETEVQEEVVQKTSRKSKKQKRKGDDIEEHYEKKMYGESIEKEEIVNVKDREKKKPKGATESESVPKKSEEEEGFDDESKLLRTIFVGNLDVKTKKKCLVKEFEEFGEIESVRIRSVPIVDDKASRKGAIIKGKINETIGRMNAYVVFSNEQSAKAALSKNMTMMGENHIRVDMACPPRSKVQGDSQLYERKKTVFVGNLPYDVKDEELYKLFIGPDQSESTVEAIRVVRDPQTSLGKGIAYILFKSRDAANTVVRRGGLKIRDRELRLCHAARADPTPAKKIESESKRDARRKKFAEISEKRESSSNDTGTKPSSASLSYQGVRSSKSGAVKKSRLSTRPGGAFSNNREARRPGGKSNKTDGNSKRPAVAARKSKQLMKKRLLEKGTSSDNARGNKKMKSQ